VHRFQVSNAEVPLFTLFGLVGLPSHFSGVRIELEVDVLKDERLLSRERYSFRRRGVGGLYYGYSVLERGMQDGLDTVLDEAIADVVAVVGR
jgi:hypothetical protein